ncbi:hypothetical protein, partial [Enterobacter hormaechei]|uniref:hypothetical protein n=1 Tax=Enterobacter hormaechei TaxID=158836 RepID=UPI001C3F10C6
MRGSLSTLHISRAILVQPNQRTELAKSAMQSFLFYSHWNHIQQKKIDWKTTVTLSRYHHMVDSQEYK